MNSSPASEATATLTLDDIADVDAVEVDYGPGLEALSSALIDAVRRNLKPSPMLTGSQWAEKHFKIGKHGSDVDLFPYQREILDAMTDPSIRQVTWMASARVGKTMLQLATVGYYIDHDPSDVMFVQPTDGDAREFAKTDVKPLFRNIPCLKRLKAPIRRGEETDTLTSYYLTNGSSLFVLGAASEDTFRRRTIKVQIGDEINAAGWATDGQGDKIRLMETRGETLWDSKLILCSTPTIKGMDRIEAEFEKGDQRRYWVPCPHCNEHQTLEWGGPETPWGVKFVRDDEGRVIDAWYVCACCGQRIEETAKLWMLEHGEWRSEKPFDGHASFHISAIYSLFPKASWKNLSREWLEAIKDPHRLLPPFINTKLGESWEPRVGDDVKPDALAEGRCESYDAEIPNGVLLCTASFDVQGDATGNGWLQGEIIGWGVGEESWHIDGIVIPTDPALASTWDEAKAWIDKVRTDASGRQFAVKAVGVDTGGAYASHVKKVVRMFDRKVTRWFAIKGANEAKGKREAAIWPKVPSVTGADRVYLVGTQSAKDLILGKYLPNDVPGTPGFMHFPDSILEDHPTWFQQLTAERLFALKSGGTYWDNPKKLRNEAIDVRVYSYAVLQGLMSQSRTMSLERLAQKLGVQTAAQAAAKAVDAEPTEPTADEDLDDVIAQTEQALRQKPQEPPRKKRPRIATSSFFRR